MGSDINLEKLKDREWVHIKKLAAEARARGETMDALCAEAEAENLHSKFLSAKCRVAYWYNRFHGLPSGSCPADDYRIMKEHQAKDEGQEKPEST